MDEHDLLFSRGLGLRGLQELFRRRSLSESSESSFDFGSHFDGKSSGTALLEDVPTHAQEVVRRSPELANLRAAGDDTLNLNIAEPLFLILLMKSSPDPYFSRDEEIVP